jgi:hypothetical protein
MVYSLKKSDESKETFVKSLEFEPETFKIDSTGWKERRLPKDGPNEIVGRFELEHGRVSVKVGPK